MSRYLSRVQPLYSSLVSSVLKKLLTRASPIGGNIQPQAFPLLLCSQPISLIKLPKSVSVTHLALALCSTASAHNLFDKIHLGFFPQGIGVSPLFNLANHHCSNPSRLCIF